MRDKTWMQSTLFTLAGGLLVLTLAACASPGAPIRRAPGEVVQGVGYSVRFPTEPGWVQAPGPSTQTSFVTSAEVKFATRAFNAEIMPLPAEAKDEIGFRELIGHEFVDRESPRFATHVDSVEVFRLESEGVWCANMDMNILQRDAVAYPGHEVPMTLQIASRLCQHPEDKAFGVMLGASYRFPSGAPDPALRERLDEFIVGFRFEPLPQR